MCCMSIRIVQLDHFKRNLASAGSDELANSNNSTDFKKITALKVHCVGD